MRSGHYDSRVSGDREDGMAGGLHSNQDLTPQDEGLPIFVSDEQEELPLPGFVTREANRSSKALIRQKIASAMAGDSSGNDPVIPGKRSSNAEG